MRGAVNHSFVRMVQVRGGMVKLNEYWKHRLAGVLSRSFPRPMAYWIGLRLADRLYARNGPDRRAVVSNLNQILSARGVIPSEGTVEGMARKTFQYFGKYLVDFFRFSSLSEKELRKLVNVEHAEYLEEAYAQGRGVIAVTAHLGNWELAGAVVAAMGYPVNAVFLPQRMKKLDDLLVKHRKRRGIG